VKIEIAQAQPRLIVEAGSWKGASALEQAWFFGFVLARGLLIFYK
jgi:hypothetical protein